MKGIELINSSLEVLCSTYTLMERYKSTISNFQQRKEQWSNNKIRIGVIGVTSSGKSTMINSILGDKILSMAVKPSSSQLVSCSQSDEKLAKVFFENRKVITLRGNRLNEKNIKKYSDENYNSNNKENVIQLELSSPKFQLGDDVILIDSPGLDAYGLENHEALTLEVLLPTIDVCIFVTTLKNNSDEKMKSVLNLIAKYKCQVLVVQNMLDSLRPSPEGDKTVEDVALDHRKRVERIINNSDIEDKNKVRIVQISAVEALKSRCDTEVNDIERDSLLKKSNYEDFVFEVKEMVKIERPNIENQRIISVVNDLKNIINEAKEDIDENKSVEDIKFQYENLDIEVFNESEKVEEKLYTLLEKLNIDKDTNKSRQTTNNLLRRLYAFSGHEYDISEADIKSLKDKVKRCERDIIKTIADFNDYLRNVAKKLNIPARDIVSINGLPSMPEPKIKTKQETIRRKVKKSGFGGKVARFFGSFLNDDWGYEYETKVIDKIDNAATKKEIEGYINRAKRMYSKEIKSWVKKTRVPIDQLIEQIENRRYAFEERRKTIIEDAKLREVVSKLEDLIKDVKITYPVKVKNKKAVKSSVLNNLEVHSFDKKTYNISKISNNISGLINRNTNELLLERYNSIKKEWLIIGWDIESMLTFAKRFCGIIFAKDMISILEDLGEFSIYKYKFYFNPSKESVDRIMNKKEGKNIYILTNATQYGSAQNQISRSGICTKLLKSDLLVFVIQDFIEIINGGGVIESIQNMTLMAESLNVNHESVIMINHSNPIYNLTIVEAQTNPPKIVKEETELLKNIQKSFRYLRDENTDNIIANIIRGTRERTRK